MRYLKYILLAISVLINISAFAQDKVVDKSSKKAPNWVDGIENNFIIISATAPTIEKAKEKIMEHIKQDIINSVAVNITSSEQYSTSTKTSSVKHDNGTKSMTFAESSLASQIESNAAVLPFINGITLSNATDYYWEKYYNKKTEKYYFVYNVKYPFTTEERLALTDKFMMMDNEKMEQLDLLTNNLNKFENIEYIAGAIQELISLEGYFFDEMRKSKTALLKNKYGMLYYQIELIPISEKLEEYKYGLFIGDRQVAYSKLPKLKSETAADLIVKRDGDKSYIITYNSQYCNEYEDNSIDIFYSFGAVTRRSSFSFDMKK